MTHAKTRSWIQRCVFLVLACAVVLVGAKLVEKAQSYAGTEGSYLPGTYTAQANGFGGPVEVTVTVGDKGGIENVDIQGGSETPDVGGAAMPLLTK